MKKFARCILILILVAILSGVGGYIYENNTMTPMYESVAKLYVVPGSQNEASIRASGVFSDSATFALLLSDD
jgi:capsular polysaccharide biosynthesis protein